ncbi:MAG: SRPBCC family protein [Gammaproteobacteria bacterium]
MLIPALLFFCSSARGADLLEIEVQREEGVYNMSSVSWLDVPPKDLYDILANHDLFTKFTSAVVESRNVEPDDEGRPQFFSRFEGCVVLYCKSFVRNGYLELTPFKELVAIVHPETSDFKRSREQWTLEPEKGGTKMTYLFEMEPDFWVPPVIGPFYIKRALKRGGEKAVDRIEALAKKMEQEAP